MGSGGTREEETLLGFHDSHQGFPLFCGGELFFSFLFGTFLYTVGNKDLEYLLKKIVFWLCWFFDVVCRLSLVCGLLIAVASSCRAWALRCLRFVAMQYVGSSWISQRTTSKVPGYLLSDSS